MLLLTSARLPVVYRPTRAVGPAGSYGPVACSRALQSGNWRGGSVGTVERGAASVAVCLVAQVGEGNTDAGGADTEADQSWVKLRRSAAPSMYPRSASPFAHSWRFRCPLKWATPRAMVPRDRLVDPVLLLRE